MKTTRRGNGIIIRDFPIFTPMATDDYRIVLEDALTKLREFHENASAATWQWTDKIYIIDQPSPQIVASTPQLLRVVAGAGVIVSDELSDRLDYGYWIYVPEGVSYTLHGQIISGMNFRVVTLPLK